MFGGVGVGSAQWRIVCTYAAVDAICPKRPGPWGVAA
jgi:hypothetical protein